MTEIKNNPITELIKETDLTAETCNIHIACFPAVSLKEYSSKDATYIKDLYSKYPDSDINYYNTHQQGTRAKLGSVKDTPLSRDSGVVNIFCRVYPQDNGNYLNDSHAARVKAFRTCVEQLYGVRMTNFHIQPHVQNAKEFEEYVNILNDMVTTYRLRNGTDLSLTIYSTVACDETSVQYKLIVGELANSTEYPLYELDFAQLVSNNDSPDTHDAPNAPDVPDLQSEKLDSSSGIMRLFPKQNRWMPIINDTKLATLADTVYTKLNDYFNESNSVEIYPPVSDLFNAFSYLETEPKIVILGQDPYHGPGQAHGLSFSVKSGIKPPPTLLNIFKALENDADIKPAFIRPKHGYLKSWAQQGVILLNAGLTVERSKPKSHLDIWTPFTDRLIELLASNYPKLVFMLWGVPAKGKKNLIVKSMSKTSSHLILEFNHPSPASPGNTFDKECKHFSLANQFLEKNGKQPVQWNLPVNI
jgi:uracil-DNA glycosylase